jgi:hypothetical protein
MVASQPNRTQTTEQGPIRIFAIFSSESDFEVSDSRSRARSLFAKPQRWQAYLVRPIDAASRLVPAITSNIIRVGRRLLTMGAHR